MDAESQYLATDMGDGVLRYLGVYVKGLDWRCYKTWASGNTAGQTLEFWVLGEGGGYAPVEPTEPAPSEPVVTEPTVPSEPEPTVPAAPESGEAVLVTEIADGMKVYIYNPGNSSVLTANVSGAVLAAAKGVVENDILTIEEGMVELTVLT